MDLAPSARLPEERKLASRADSLEDASSAPLGGRIDICGGG
jgi:hypothetical protein